MKWFLLVVAALAGFWLVATLAHSRSGGFRRGMAGGMNITSAMSAAAVRRRAYVTRPATVTTRRTPVRHVGIELVRVRWLLGKLRSLFATHEDVVLVVAPPRTGKTGLLATAGQDAPGALFTTSSKPDLCTLIRPSRAQRPEAVFNPEGDGGIRNTLRWSPVYGCRDPHYALLVAGLLVGAVSDDNRKDGTFWEGNAVTALRCLLAAADCADKDMHDVVRWAGDLTTEQPGEILEGHTDELPGWDVELQQIRELPRETLKSVGITLAGALRYMALPSLAELACPPRTEQFNVADMLRTGASLHVIGQHRDESPIGPLFAALTGVLFTQAKALAATSRGGRLDPPLTMVLDEPTNTFRLPLDEWTSDAGGRGIPMVIAAQGRHQLRIAWGDEGAKAIWSNAAIKVTFGGNMDEDTLNELSTLCGDRPAEYGAQHRRPILTARDILQLPDGQVLVLRRNTPPVIGEATMAWERSAPPVAEPLVPAAQEPQDASNVVQLADHARKAA